MAMSYSNKGNDVHMAQRGLKGAQTSSSFVSQGPLTKLIWPHLFDQDWEKIFNFFLNSPLYRCAVINFPLACNTVYM